MESVFAISLGPSSLQPGRTHNILSGREFLEAGFFQEVKGMKEAFILSTSPTY